MLSLLMFTTLAICSRLKSILNNPNTFPQAFLLIFDTFDPFRRLSASFSSLSAFRNLLLTMLLFKLELAIRPKNFLYFYIASASYHKRVPWQKYHIYRQPVHVIFTISIKNIYKFLNIFKKH